MTSTATTTALAAFRAAFADEAATEGPRSTIQLPMLDALLAGEPLPSPVPLAP